MPILPRPYADEVIGSLVVRGCRLTGLPLKRFLRSVHGSRRGQYSFLMGDGFARLALLAGMTPDELLLRHTVFPYAVAFMAPAEQRRLLGKALSLAEGSSLSSLTKNATRGAPLRRLCAQCVDADMSKYGESYWRRSHQLPGVLTCIHHGVELQQALTATCGASGSDSLLMPHETAACLLYPSASWEQLRQVTEIATAALRGTLEPNVSWTTTFRERALSLGYRLASGNVAGVLLAMQMRDHFGSSFLEQCGCDIPLELGRSWPTLLVRPGGTPNLSTAKYVLMHAFLQAGVPAPSTVASVYRQPGKKTRDYASLDARSVEVLREQIERVSAIGARIGVSDLLQSAGVVGAFKHSRSKLPLTEELILDFKRSSLAARQLGRRPRKRTK